MVAVDPFRFRVYAHHPVHHQAATFAELVDRTDGIDGLVKCPTGVEVLLDGREQVLTGLIGVWVVGRVDPEVLEGFVGGHARFGIHGQTPFDEIPGVLRDTPPIFKRSKRIVSCKDGLHLFQVGVAVKGGVAAE